MGGLKLSITLSIIMVLFPYSSMAEPIGIYWGPDGRFDQSLLVRCKSGLYGIVNIAFLATFGNGRTPSLNLTGHCDGPEDRISCNSLYSQIKLCQTMGIKVLLSIGGNDENYSLSSADEAADLATFIWNNFLSGQSPNRLLGDAVFDGVDFFVDFGTGEFWGELAWRLRQFGRFIISAAPPCSKPEAFVAAANGTGIFDFVWVRFYNNPSCMFQDDSADKLLASWRDQWSTFSVGTLFLGLPASAKAAPGGGFIPAEMLGDKVLQMVYNDYGGIMLWNSYFDDILYSSSIKRAM